MRRREFLLGAAAAASWPPAGRAQSTKIPRVGYVWVGVRDSHEGLSGLRKGLVDRGYELGRNLMLEERYAAGDPTRIPALIAELLALDVDALVTVGSAMTLVARKATSSVPIVCVAGDFVGVGLAASLAHPGGNVTGISLLSATFAAKWLELLKAAAPKLGRVGVLWDPDSPTQQAEMRLIDEAGQRFNLSPARLSVLPQELQSSLEAINSTGIDGLIVCDATLAEALIPRIIALAAQNRVPTIYAFAAAVRQGGLMSYGADFFEIWRRAAGHVDRILKGAKPQDLPIEQATEISLTINLATAKALGLEIQPTLLARATEVIE